MSAPKVDIGSGVTIQRFTCIHGPGGYFIQFGEEPASGGVSICGECPGATWKVEMEEPLTLSPSILQHAIPDLNMAEHHGYIRAGRWESA